jgi:hypothetical protein
MCRNNHPKGLGGDPLTENRIDAMNPKTGLYEQRIDVMLEGRLRELPDSAYEIQREKVDEAEAHAVLSRYLQRVMGRKLIDVINPKTDRSQNQLTSSETPNSDLQRDYSNDIIDLQFNL